MVIHNSAFLDKGKITSLADLPIKMAERAKQARLLAAENPSDIQLDDEFIPWIYSTELESWVSFNGNWSGKSPEAKREDAKKWIDKKEAYNKACDEKLLEAFDVHAYWSKIRQDVLERDNHTCQCCGKQKTSKLHVHHIMKRSKGGTDHFDNLITLCSSCHGSADSTYYDVDWGVEPVTELENRKFTEVLVNYKLPKPASPQKVFVDF